MKFLSFLLLCFFSQISTAQISQNKILTFDYQLLKDNILVSKLAIKAINSNEKIIVKLLTPTGDEKKFIIEENSNFSAELALKYPDIQTYIGTCLEDKRLSVRFDISSAGYSAIYNNHGEMTIIEPTDLLNNQYKIIPYEETQSGWECGILEYKSLERNKVKRLAKPNSVSNGANLKILRTAIATTGEFTSANGGTVANALARINSILTIVNAVYMVDMSLKFELVNNTNIIFTDATTDPFTPGSNPSSGQSGTVFRNFNTNGTLLYENYDIGHTLHVSNPTGGTSSSGVATLNVVCDDFWKAQGWTQYRGTGTTSINSLVGGILTHEFGHQLGANHNFNSNVSNCGNQLGDQFEPGSGTTIMAYLGLCGSQNLSGVKDDFFHIASMESMLMGLSFYSVCGVNTALTNALPVVNAGTDYTVPSNTPFVLKGAATDANNDPLTYIWEQKNEGVYNDAGSLGQTNGVGGYAAVISKTAPLFRSIRSNTTAVRSFPALKYVLNNANNPIDTVGEDLSIANRAIIFSLTAKDNKIGGGGTVSDEIVVTVDSLKGPFVVTFPNTAIPLGAGSSQTVTWSVNNTNILSPNIDILISTNGSNANPTFITLKSNTPNDGSEIITLPSTLTSQGRIKIVSKNSSTAEFYDISNVNFSIVTACPTTNVVFSSNKSGIWSDLTVWNCGSIVTNRLPNITDTVKINSGHMVTLDINASIKILNLIGNLNLNAGRALNY